MVDLAITAGCVATRSFAEILSAPLRGRPRKAPNVVALPGATTLVAAPGASTRHRDRGVAPLAVARLASPRRQRTGDAFTLECAQLAGRRYAAWRRTASGATGRASRRDAAALTSGC
ncbi:MAG: hypothetical protein EBX51_04780 [Acidimicrobiia bacterium]|nr:hypothetical protein [Acidimicrobiia bacterium]